MKKTIAFILAAFMLVMFAGCVANDVEESSQYKEGMGTTTDKTSSNAESNAIDESNGSEAVSGESSSSGDESLEESSKPTTTVSYDTDEEIISGLFDGEVSYEYDADLINILLVGADTYDKGTGRSDSMIIMSINKTKKTITFTSLMRDLYVPIPGYKDNRINASYSAGGPALLMKTIDHNFGIKIDYYVRVGFAAFRGAIDSLGGLDIVVNKDNYDYFKDFDEIKGLSKEEATNGNHIIHISGKTALHYARSRDFAGSDFTRTLHQRDLISQVIKNCRGSSVTELHEMLKIVLPYIVTNIPKDMLKMMVFEAINYINYDIVTARVPCNGSYEVTRRRGMSVLVADMEKNKAYLYSKIFGE